MALGWPHDGDDTPPGLDDTLSLALSACAPEPRVIEDQIVFRDSLGRELFLDEVLKAPGTVSWEIVGRGDVPGEAVRLHEAGRQAGARGQYEEALRLLAEAAAQAPDWPYPPYDAAFTYLLVGDFEQALEYYRRTVALAPQGFFTALTAVQSLELEEAGLLPAGTYLAYVQLESMQDPEAKEARVRAILSAAPSFAPAWKELALLVTDDAERLRIIERGLDADPDPETRGILLINQAIIRFNRGERDEAISILGNLALDPASSTGSAVQAKADLALLLGNDQGR